MLSGVVIEYKVSYNLAMRISRIVIRNFRNFEYLDVRIQPGVTCIIGENNTGKTNLLHAIRLALDINLPPYFRQLTENDTHCCKPFSQAQQVLISIEITDYQDKPEECALCGLWEVGANLARITYRFRPQQAVREAIERGARDATALAVDDYRWELSAGASGTDNNPADVTWDSPCGSAVRFQELQAFKIDFLPALRDVESDLHNARTSPLNRLLSALDIPQDQQDALVQLIREANNSVEQTPTIHAAGEAITGAFADAAGEAFALPVRLGMISPTFASITRDLSVLLTNGPVIDFEPSRNGLGLNNILYVSMLLEYFRRRVNRPDTAGQLLLIEEPEAHLHPQLQRILYAKLKESQFQTFITTHSAHISSASPFDSFLILTNTGEMATSSTVASDIANLSGSEKADLERYLDATRSILLFARKVILVEGPAELFLIPRLAKKVLDVDLERHGISVIPIHGVHFSCYAKLFSLSGLNKKCAIITDSDLVPSDGGVIEETEEEDDLPLPRLQDLRALENDYLKIFCCETTFERTLAIPGMLEVLHKTAEELQAPRVAARLSAAIETLRTAPTTRERADALRGLDSAVLNTAKRFGKARFAQIASKHVAAHATDLPEYIREAIEWLIQDDTDA